MGTVITCTYSDIYFFFFFTKKHAYWVMLSCMLNDYIEFKVFRS